ncbi:hypothetical protein C0991_003775 [Blastosporella zonata]|nr:hypothetical protein C0991_003775 [Blastosporella zonata]
MVISGVGLAAGAYYISQCVIFSVSRNLPKNDSVSHVSLEQVPETGRWRFMNVKPAAEESIGRISREEILKEYQHHILPPNHILSRHVRRVVTQILTASNLGHIRGESSGLLPHLVQPPFGGEPGDEAAWDPDAQWGKSSDGGSGQPSEREWDVIVVNDPKVVNAMATPGANAWSWSLQGFSPYAKTSKALLRFSHTASLPQHPLSYNSNPYATTEIGHVVARHTAERISSQTVIYSLLGLASFLGLDVGFTQVVQHFLLELPNSRTQELEADKIGLKLMSKACFDPQGAIDMFERMTRLQGSSKIDFFNTHPSGTKRGEELSKLLPEAYDVLNSSPDCAAMQDRLRSFREVAIRGPGVEDF